MAITFRGGAKVGVTNGGTITVNLSTITGLAQNDIVIAAAASTAGTVATPSGYTLIYAEGGFLPFFGVYYKVMGASPDTSLSFWASGTANDSGVGMALAFTGVDTASPIDGNTLTGGIDPIARTPSVNDCAVVVFTFEATIGGAVDTSPGTITNYTVDNTSAADTNNSAMGRGYRILTGGAGASENPAAWSTWVNIGDAYSLTIVIKPLGVGQPSRKRMGGVTYSQPIIRSPNVSIW